ncbi:MAG: redoxin domain-containing protein [Anaerolineae bacterium]|nr:redoxin domain-containing protein [Anaerolineae bacterium]
MNDRVRRWAAWIGAFICFVIAAALIASAGLPERERSLDALALQIPAPIPGALAPSFETQLLDGSQLALDDLRGRTVILNFWATWCAPCEIEMPDLQALNDVYASQGLRVVGINSGEDRAAIVTWTERLQLSFDIALDQDLSITTLYGVNGQPTTFVINADGRIERVFYGLTTRDQLESEIALALAS